MSEQPDRATLRSTILEQIAQHHIRFIELHFCDLFGALKSVTVPAQPESKLADVLDRGSWFDGSSIEGYARVAETDLYLVPDLTTFAPLPWTVGTAAPAARLMCEVRTPRGDAFAGDPRAALRRAIADAASLGFAFHTAPELEFFVFDTASVPGALSRSPLGWSGPQTVDRFGSVANVITNVTGGAFGERAMPADYAGYFDQSADSSADLLRGAADALTALDVAFTSFHHEVAPGQYELDMQLCNALKTADDVVTAKYALRTIARHQNARVTFIPKPAYGLIGSGMHIHQTLLKIGQDGSAFSEPNGQYGLSPVARQFIAGLMHHARGMTAVLAPTVNSYKRLVPGFEAPAHVSWARVNRGAMVRVPHLRPDDPTTIEVRTPDPACNPYLALAVMLRAGLDGIRRRMTLPDPIEENLFQFDEGELQRRNIASLPETLVLALDALKGDALVQDALGERIFENFMAAKTEEWTDYRRHVSPWELERYFDIA